MQVGTADLFRSRLKPCIEFYLISVVNSVSKVHGNEGKVLLHWGFIWYIYIREDVAHTWLPA